MQIIKEGKYYELTSNNWNDAIYFYVVKIKSVSDSKIRGVILSKNKSSAPIYLYDITITLPVKERDTYKELTVEEYLQRMGLKHADN